MLYDQYKFRVRVTVHFIISIHFNDISHENFVFLTQIVVKQITLTLIFCCFQLFGHVGASTHAELCTEKIVVFKPPGSEAAVELKRAQCLSVADNNCICNGALSDHQSNHRLKWFHYHLILASFKPLFCNRILMLTTSELKKNVFFVFFM